VTAAACAHSSTVPLLTFAYNAIQPMDDAL